jgi:hypothetical protein
MTVQIVHSFHGHALGAALTIFATCGIKIGERSQDNDQGVDAVEPLPKFRSRHSASPSIEPPMNA